MSRRIRFLVLVLLSAFALGTTACADLVAPRGGCGTQGSQTCGTQGSHSGTQGSQT